MLFTGHPDGDIFQISELSYFFPSMLDKKSSIMKPHFKARVNNEGILYRMVELFFGVFFCQGGASYM